MAPQLFHIIKSRQLMLLAAKTVDDVLVTGFTSEVDKFLTCSNARFELGTIAHGLGSMRFCRMKIVQNENRT